MDLKNYVSVVYTGVKKFQRDRQFGSGAIWEKQGSVQKVAVDIASKLVSGLNPYKYEDESDSPEPVNIHKLQAQVDALTEENEQLKSALANQSVAEAVASVAEQTDEEYINSFEDIDNLKAYAKSEFDYEPHHASKIEKIKADLIAKL